MRSERIYYSFQFVKSLAFGFLAALYIPYLLDVVGLSYGEVSLVNAIFWLTILLAEVPTGMIADGRGRGFSIVLGSVAMLIGAIVYFFAGSFIAVAIAESLVGIGFAFYSGALDAWVVDAKDRASSLHVIYGRKAIAQGVGTWTGILGGWLVTHLINLHAIYGGFTVAISILLLIAWVFMRNGQEERRLSEREALVASWRQLRDDQAMRWIVLVRMSFGAVSVFNMYWTPVALTVLDVSQLSLLFIPMYGALIIAGWLVTRHKGDVRHEARNVVLSIGFTFLPLAGVWIGQPFILMAGCFILHEFSRGAYPILTSIFIDRRITPDHRATLQSLTSFAASVGMGGVLFTLWLLFKFMPDTPEMVIWVWRVTAIIMAIVCFFLYRIRPKTR